MKLWGIGQKGKDQNAEVVAKAKEQLGMPILDILKLRRFDVPEPMKILSPDFRFRFNQYEHLKQYYNTHLFNSPATEEFSDKKLNEIATRYSSELALLRWKSREQGYLAMLPIKQEVRKIVGDFLFEVIDRHIKSTKRLYRGVEFSSREQMNDYFNSKKMQGKSTMRSVMSVSAFEDVANAFASNSKFGAVTVFDANSIVYGPVPYMSSLSGYNCTMTEGIFFRVEAEVRVLQVPENNIVEVRPVVRAAAV
ncbi:MAG: hypothetical protein KGH61_00105 [Candidatus Micrarchaeota archaeon]|nr:hypothetical protein [Candidatus Micrarchaeota archaeon]MDE1847339.1 hypothetical protein [Candidatus Micrarchaeota archaeon]MDE1863954.1 hypothetical protein [Candidatus Micrarchaeota archaeon]